MRYVLLIGSDDKNAPPPTQAQMDGIIQGHMRFGQELHASGKMVVGERLRPDTDASRIRVKAGHRQVMDGPFAETKEALGGFYLIEAATKEEAVEWGKKIPLLEGGFDVGVHQLGERRNHRRRHRGPEGRQHGGFQPLPVVAPAMRADGRALRRREATPVPAGFVDVRPLLAPERLAHHAGAAEGTAEESRQEIGRIRSGCPAPRRPSRTATERLGDEGQTSLHGRPQVGIDDAQLGPFLSNPTRPVAAGPAGVDRSPGP